MYYVGILESSEGFVYLDKGPGAHKTGHRPFDDAISRSQTSI